MAIHSGLTGTPQHDMPRLHVLIKWKIKVVKFHSWAIIVWKGAIKVNEGN